MGGTRFEFGVIIAAGLIILNLGRWRLNFDRRKFSPIDTVRHS
jgi:hypothetical protein